MLNLNFKEEYPDTELLPRMMIMGSPDCETWGTLKLVLPVTFLWL